MGLFRKGYTSYGEQSARTTADRISASHATQRARAAQADDIRAPIDAGMAPQVRQLAADGATRALQYGQDPKMRKMLIDQYRAAGIDLGEDG